MPVIIRNSVETPTTSSPQNSYERYVRRMADVVAQLRQQAPDVRSLAIILDNLGYTTAAGKRFSYGSTWRLLRRLSELGVGAPPRSKRTARRHAKPPCHTRRSPRGIICGVLRATLRGDA